MNTPTGLDKECTDVAVESLDSSYRVPSDDLVKIDICQQCTEFIVQINIRREPLLRMSVDGIEKCQKMLDVGGVKGAKDGR